MKNTVLFSLLLAGLIFLLAPTSKVKALEAVEIGCTSVKGYELINGLGVDNAISNCYKKCATDDGNLLNCKIKIFLEQIFQAYAKEAVVEVGCTSGKGYEVLPGYGLEGATAKCYVKCIEDDGNLFSCKVQKPIESKPSATLTYHCIVVDEKVGRNSRGDCVEFQSVENLAVAKEDGNKVCANSASTADKVKIEKGPCPGPGPLAGTSAEDLQKEALGKLNPAKISAPTTLINRAIRGLMAFIGSISLVLYVYAGILWMTASGNAEQVNKAKTTMVWTTLGVVIMLSSYMLAGFLFNAIPK